MKINRNIKNKCVMVVGAVILLSCMPSSDCMTRLEDGTYVIDTTSLCENVKGFRGATPIKIYVKNDKVMKLEYLPNQETPRFFARLKDGFQDLWNGQKVDKAKALEPDGHTGASFSARAITENVRIALEYYQKHKK